jgi:KUP system potassium uptake protein
MKGKQTEQVISEEPGKLSGKEKPPDEPGGEKLFVLSLTALGVVFGDIGTNPLYAFRECFFGHNPVEPTAANVLGVLSFIFWSLVLVISIKYLIYVMRADNGGEGGVLALMALTSPWRKMRGGGGLHGIIAVAVFGAALLYGDAVITPAISVLSAIEGLKVATPALHRYVVPITVLVLILLFVFQRRGTAGIGSVFGPVMLLWFCVIGILGVYGIMRQPHVLVAVIPTHAIHFFLSNGWYGFLVLGAVFLVVTGGEALYADIGHFTRRTIRFAWFLLVLPALLLNYFGQGALLLTLPAGTNQPFYLLAPGWALYPMVALSTAATVIASQAMISGVFSMTRQAVFLGLFPRLLIIQTSAQRFGQIYIPSLNWALMTASIAIVLGFRTSSNLAVAYGVAVSATMAITTMLAYFVARERWRWSLHAALLVTVGFLGVDLVFFSANTFRVIEGGWVPLLIAGLVFLLMSTWRRGSTAIQRQLEKETKTLDAFVKKMTKEHPVRLPGAAVFMSKDQRETLPMLLRHVQLNGVLHKRVLLLTVSIEDVPRIPQAQRLEIIETKQGISRITLHVGFMEHPSVQEALAARQKELDTDPVTATYYVGGETFMTTDKKPGMARWRDKLFKFMARNAAELVPFYSLPPERVIEFGINVKL